MELLRRKFILQPVDLIDLPFQDLALSHQTTGHDGQVGLRTGRFSLGSLESLVSHRLLLTVGKDARRPIVLNHGRAVLLDIALASDANLLCGCL